MTPGAVSSSLVLKIMAASNRKLYLKLWEMLFWPPEMLERSATEQNNIAQTGRSSPREKEESTIVKSQLRNDKLYTYNYSLTPKTSPHTSQK
ncbi:unnamed protein product [Ixodes pacificus]